MIVLDFEVFSEYLNFNKTKSYLWNVSEYKLLAYHVIQGGEKLIDNCSEIAMMSIFIVYKCVHNDRSN